MVQGTNNVDYFYQKLALICIGGLVLAMTIFLGLVPLISHLNKPAYLDILVPIGTTVKINGQEYNSAVYEFEPGDYQATVTLGNLEPKTYDLKLNKNETTGLYLTWSENGGWKQLTAEELAHKHEIKKILPLYLSICGTPAKRTNCDAISINYDRVPECKGQECIVIDGRRAELTDEALTAIRDKLSENGYNLDDYQYVYVQNENR
ncbi:MAG: hypothetical protein K6G49_01865 [Candidatus Saccharibacteria bacterium]|nr:hypothetical protein [Candidatus Saccharibacteria bacterium]